MSAIATFKTKYENHTIIYNVEPCFLGYKLELSIDDRFWDSAKSTDNSDPRNIDLQGSFVEKGEDFIVLVRLKKTFSDLVDIAPTLYINNKEVPLIRTN